MRHGREHAKHRQLAHVALAEIAFQSPDRDQNLPWHAVFGLDARQKIRVASQHRAPAIDAAGAYAGRNILLESLGESAALAAVKGEHAKILLHATERLRDRGLRDTGGCRFRGHALHEGVEIAAATGGVSGSREREATGN